MTELQRSEERARKYSGGIGKDSPIGRMVQDLLETIDRERRRKP